MNQQETFNKVATHLMKQGVKSLGPHGCLYRGPNNTTCAVGCLIPNKNYRTKMESLNIVRLVDEFPELKNILGRGNIDLLESLQFTHDKPSVKHWKERLIATAKNYNLSLPPCLQDKPVSKIKQKTNTPIILQIEKPKPILISK